MDSISWDETKVKKKNHLIERKIVRYRILGLWQEACQWYLNYKSSGNLGLGWWNTEFHIRVWENPTLHWAKVGFLPIIDAVSICQGPSIFRKLTSHFNRDFCHLVEQFPPENIP